MAKLPPEFMKSKTNTKSKVNNISISRLYNLGSYEHMKVELSVSVSDDDSASKVLQNLERIVEAMEPRRDKVEQYDIDREERRVNEMLSERNKIGDDEFKRRHGHFEGTPLEYIARCAKSVEEQKQKRANYVERQAKARKMLDDLNGECTWKDHKLDWEDGYLES